MIERFNIAGYVRISVDEEMDRDNTSIENQKAIIREYTERSFPGSTLTYYEDRDRSGYTFEQREGYQSMRPHLLDRSYDILIVKDFSRFSRRNSRGLVELEDLRDCGLRIIAIGDSIDYPTYDDWTSIQFRFLVNEMPVTDASKKVRAVVKRRQEDGKWICAAPYGYIVSKKQEFEVCPEEAEVIRQIFELYNEGWGYKKIANRLTELGIPTPRMSEKMRKESAGEEYNREVKMQWSIITVQGILDNDFYIGTLRQHKYARKKINGADIKIENDEHIVIENHHEAIIEPRVFSMTREQREARTKSNYRGVKINENAYSGYLFCGDCGSPMFAMSRRDLKPAYTCGTYHRRGLTGCTSHHIRVDRLDELLKIYLRRVRENSTEMLGLLDEELKKESQNVDDIESSTRNIEKHISELRDELKATKRQRVRDIMRHPDDEEMLEQTYDELEAELMQRIAGLENHLTLGLDRRNTIIRTNRASRTVLDIFKSIEEKETLSKTDVGLMVEKITVFEDHIEIALKSDIDTLIRSGRLLPHTLSDGECEPVNFKSGTEDIEKVCRGDYQSLAGEHSSPLQEVLVQASDHRKDKVFRVNVISDGDPLEIYTEKDGEVIFKKYSPVSELSDFAGKICESLYKSGDAIAIICDRDSIISSAGVPKKEVGDKRISEELSSYMEARKIYRAEGGAGMPLTDSGNDYFVSVAAPILSEGDLMGCALFATKQGGEAPTEVQAKLISTVASFLGKQMEA